MQLFFDHTSNIRFYMHSERVNFQEEIALVYQYKNAPEYIDKELCIYVYETFQNLSMEIFEAAYILVHVCPYIYMRISLCAHVNHPLYIMVRITVTVRVLMCLKPALYFH